MLNLSILKSTKPLMGMSILLVLLYLVNPQANAQNAPSPNSANSANDNKIADTSNSSTESTLKPKINTNSATDTNTNSTTDTKSTPEPSTKNELKPEINTSSDSKSNPSSTTGTKSENSLNNDSETERAKQTNAGAEESKELGKNATIGKVITSTIKGENNERIKSFIIKSPVTISSFVICSVVGTPIAIGRCLKREIPVRIKETNDIGGVPKKFGSYFYDAFFGIPSGIMSGVCFGVCDGVYDSYVGMEDAPFSQKSISLEKLYK